MSVEVASQGASVLVRWGGTVTMDDVLAVRQVLDAVIRHQPEPLVYVSIIPTGSRPPAPEVRRAMVQSISSPERCEVVYLVVGSSGLWGSLIRTVLAGMLLLVGGFSSKVEVVGSLDAVTAARAARGDPAPGRFAALVAALRPCLYQENALDTQG